MMSLAQAARALAADGLACRIAGAEAAEFAKVSIDTRTLEPGALYVALRGPRFDGHEFAQEARARGAVALLVERPVPVDLPQLVAADTRRGLGLIAACWRAQFSFPVISVTGSNGKTTTTQMIASVLAQAYGEHDGRRCWFATKGNRNNEIGVPLMLLELRREHRAAVLELGMNHPGEIGLLSQWVRPTVALVTNAQREHQEFLDSVEATARENGFAIAALPADGTAVFAADDACAAVWRDLAGTRRVLDFALHGAATVGADFRLGTRSCQLRIRAPGATIATELALSGEHNVRNALAASAACLAVGIGAGDIAAGLAAFRPVGGRGTWLAGRGGATLIDESYNANPDSVRAAIDLLAQCEGYRVLVFGDMGEVGSRAEEFHREIGRYAHERGIDRLLALGPQAQAAVDAFGAGASHFDTVEELIGAALELTRGGAAPTGATASPGPVLAAGITILAKGSRFMRLERVVRALEQDPPSDARRAQGVPQDHA
ncbi:UDP-N-acetylmuramoyl-tripeptide--D-alanyl-D-alanine ligase [Burkholderiales bacterium]|nr:UDP-N-acetylmuramoyl-tripeptide--D-alanyl-D-alanine ligase [Burkholderiales bacterium]